MTNSLFMSFLKNVWKRESLLGPREKEIPNWITQQ